MKEPFFGLNASFFKCSKHIGVMRDHSDLQNAFHFCFTAVVGEFAGNGASVNMD